MLRSSYLERVQLVLAIWLFVGHPLPRYPAPRALSPSPLACAKRPSRDQRCLAANILRPISPLLQSPGLRRCPLARRRPSGPAAYPAIATHRLASLTSDRHAAVDGFYPPPSSDGQYAPEKLHVIDMTQHPPALLITDRCLQPLPSIHLTPHYIFGHSLRRNRRYCILVFA